MKQDQDKKELNNIVQRFHKKSEGKFQTNLVKKRLSGTRSESAKYHFDPKSSFSSLLKDMIQNRHFVKKLQVDIKYIECEIKRTNSKLQKIQQLRSSANNNRSNIFEKITGGIEKDDLEISKLYLGLLNSCDSELTRLLNESNSLSQHKLQLIKEYNKLREKLQRQNLRKQ